MSLLLTKRPPGGGFVNCDTYLLTENRLGLTTETLLLTIVTTTTLGRAAFLGFLVLCHLMQFVALAFFAECAALLGHVHLRFEELFRMRLVGRHKRKHNPVPAHSPIVRTHTTMRDCGRNDSGTQTSGAIVSLFGRHNRRQRQAHGCRSFAGRWWRICAKNS